MGKVLAHSSSLLTPLITLNRTQQGPVWMQCPAMHAMCPVFGPMRFLALAREAGNFLERSECRTV